MSEDTSDSESLYEDSDLDDNTGYYSDAKDFKVRQEYIKFYF